ncbi:MAG: hypothetical protein JW862_19400 [Anaerolineales bacterium]|nr:hypothetical protein [Anaerolineales bacterium]
MAEIRCPMCSQLNPDHLEVCQYCQARLKPLVADSGQAQDDSGLPDWLRSLGDDLPLDEDEAAPLSNEDESQDWLDRLGSEQPEQPENAEPEPLAADEAGDVDWLQDFRALDDETLPEISSPEEPPDQAELPDAVPDWMAEAGLAPTDDDEDGVPDWLERFGETPVESEPAAPLHTSELPDWLSRMGAMEAESQDSVTAEPEDDDHPEWLAEIADQVSPQGADQGLPDWLSEIDGPAIAAADESQDFPEPEIDIPDWLGAEDSQEVEPETAEDANLPEWLAEMSGFSIPEEPAQDLPLEDVQLGEQESRAVPNWLRDMESVVEEDQQQDLGDAWEDYEPPPEPEGIGAAPFVVEDEFSDDLLDVNQLPDWIAEGTEPKDEAGEDALAQADLPSWVEAMRPVDPGAGAQVLGPLETAGPLSGLHSVLSAEPEVAQIKKPPVYSSKLHFTEAQQMRTEMLETLLEQEGRPRPVPRPALISSQGVLRWIVGAVMIILVGLVIATGSQVAPLPQVSTIPIEVSQASRIVQSLPAEARVLIAFDYEPGLSGEMQFAAAPVVNHLMLKAARLTLVSTSPTGPALAEHFIHTVQSQHNYQSGEQYINLGYIPGGVTGLLGFAEIPYRITPISFDGLDAWQAEPLDGIKTLSDFDLLIVITDNPNTGRAWVEQVQPAMPAVPLLAVISAQAEPLIRPYYMPQDAQVDGMVSGILGGAFYERATQVNLAPTYWDAFNIGLVLAVAAILIGGVMQLISLLLAGRAERQGTVA